MSGIPNTIPATASTFLGIPAINARFWGRRPFDFELDVETLDAEQNNTETGSQNRTRAEQETKHDQAQDRTQTEGGSRTQVSPFTFFWEGPVLGSAPFFVARFWGRRPSPRVF